MATQRSIYEQLLRKHSAAIAVAFRDAIAAAGRAVNLKDLSEAIESGQLIRAAELLRLDAITLFPVLDAIRSTYMAGGGAAAAAVPSAAVFGFDGRHDRAERWIRSNAGTLVQGITDNTLEMVRTVVDDGVARGRSSRSVALDITGRLDKTTGRRTGGFLGTTRQQAGAVVRARRELIELDAAYFDRKLRDKRFDATVRKAIESGKPLTATKIEQITRGYKNKQLAYRGRLIATDQAHTALSAGRDEGYTQLLESGQVDAVTKRWQWNDTGQQDPRETHQALDGQVIGIDDVFYGIGGAPMKHPHDPDGGAVNNLLCRCVAIYRVEVPR